MIMNTTASANERLDQLGISLPVPTPPVGAYTLSQRSGNLVFVSGHVAKREGKPWVGRLGADITLEQGQAAARAVAIDVLGTLQQAVGDLDEIRQILKLTVLVNSAPTFTEQHLVANGASELFEEIFGEAGRHARIAYGVAQLPLGACVEIDIVAEVK